MIILSGPEPQRALLEKKLKEAIKTYDGKVIFIKGVVEQIQKIKKTKNTTYYNFMTRSQIEESYNQSKVVLCRSGYTTIIDLAKLNKKAFFIPTPGQTEQLYLAQKLEQEGIAPYDFQDDFNIENLKKIANYKGFNYREETLDWELLFRVFDLKKNTQIL